MTYLKIKFFFGYLKHPFTHSKHYICYPFFPFLLIVFFCFSKMLKNRSSSDKQMNAFRVGEVQTHFWLKIHFFQIVFKIVPIAEKLMISFRGVQNQKISWFLFYFNPSLNQKYSDLIWFRASQLRLLYKRVKHVSILQGVDNLYWEIVLK